LLGLEWVEVFAYLGVAIIVTASGFEAAAMPALPIGNFALRKRPAPAKPAADLIATYALGSSTGSIVTRMEDAATAAPDLPGRDACWV